MYFNYLIQTIKIQTHYMFQFKKIFSIAILSIFSILGSYAQKPIYGFAYCINLKDSVVYLSSPQQLPNAQIGKQKFLNHREDYGEQFSKYIQQLYNLPHVTTVVYFAKNRSALEKKYLKAKRIAKSQLQRNVVEIGYSDFQFAKIE